MRELILELGDILRSKREKEKNSRALACRDHYRLLFDFARRQGMNDKAAANYAKSQCRE